MQHADQVAYIERMHGMARANARDDGEISHTSVEEYFDTDRFEREKAVLFRKYPVVVAFSAQLRKPGDFVANNDSGQPILVARGTDGKLRAFLNACRHRGAQVAQGCGHAGAFTCPYHGWTYSNDGKLRGYPFPSGYEGVDRNALGLGRVARVGIYKGFVFGSLSAKGISLEEHLGPAMQSIDALCENSPEGEVQITAGFLQHRAKANWKFLVENETDGYHPSFVHASIFEVAKSGIGGLYSGKSTAVSRDFGNGHTENDLRPEFRLRDEPMSWFGTTANKLPDYTARMNATYGPEKARKIMIDGTPHIMIYPNLFIAEIQIFVIQPVAVNETVQHVTALQFKGAPDLNRRLRQQTMGSVGPAGFLLADDSEMYERTQMGVQMKQPEWLFLGRGKHRERRDENGFLIGDATDETPTRGIWRHYRGLMEAA